MKDRDFGTIFDSILFLDLREVGWCWLIPNLKDYAKKQEIGMKREDVKNNDVKQ
ncbi:MAG: hypothetical protein IJK78_11935 [Bacteroidales bacterium]|nr:hypothetical protein [Bacteroidales bacterium]